MFGSPLAGLNFQLTTTVISKTEGHPYGLQKLSQNNQEFRLMCRICQLCLSQLWSDQLSPVDSVREGCVGKAICEEGEGVVPQGGTADGLHDSWREEVQIQEKQVPSSGIGRANTESYPPTHTHTPWTLLAQRELRLCYSEHFSTGNLKPWLMASCQLPAS